MKIYRVWRDGDTLELILPLNLQCEQLPANGTPHPEIVALVHGPLVLFALREPSDAGMLVFKGDALLKAEQISPTEWVAQATAGPRRFVPFTAIGEQMYSTYVMLA